MVGKIRNVTICVLKMLLREAKWATNRDREHVLVEKNAVVRTT